MINKKIFRFALSIADQLAFSGANFVFSILVARWMSVPEFGYFSVAYTMLILMSAVHGALVVEPISVFWHREDGENNSYIPASVNINCAFSICAFLIFLAITLSISVAKGDTFRFFADLTVAASALILPSLWFLKQALFNKFKPHYALSITAVYILTLFTSLVLFRNFSHFDHTLAMSCFSVAGLLSTLLGFAVFFQVRGGAKLNYTAALAKKCLQYGAWSLPSNIFAWIGARVFVVALPIWSGVSQAAVFSAFINFLFPFQQVLQGISSLLLPTLSKQFAKGGQRQNRHVNLLLFGAILGGAAYGATLFFMGPYVFTLVYGEKYFQGEILSRLGFLIPIPLAVMTIVRTVLRADNQPKAIFLSFVFGIFLPSLIIVPLAASKGAAGAVIGFTALQLLLAASLIYCLVRWRNSKKLTDVAPGI